jgi:hypothetical protein
MDLTGNFDVLPKSLVSLTVSAEASRDRPLRTEMESTKPCKVGSDQANATSSTAAKTSFRRLDSSTASRMPVEATVWQIENSDNNLLARLKTERGASVGHSLVQPDGR